jgi:arabinofuranan 3-O-arabinosyltransferase
MRIQLSTVRGTTQAPPRTRSTHRARAAIPSWAPTPTAAWAYLAPSLVAGVTVQFWFRGDSGLAGGDLTPPIAPSDAYLAHWNQLVTGAGGPGYSIVWLPFYAGLRLFRRLGLSEVAFQRVWLSVLVAGSAAAVVFLAHQLLRSPLPAAVAGFLAIFNAYHLSTGFDPVPLSATIAAAVLGGLVIRAGRQERGAHPLLFAVASMTLGFVFINPPHLVLVLLWIAISALLACVAFGRVAGWRIGRFLLVGGTLSILFNLWWIVPATLTINSSVFAQQFVASGVVEWSWTQARSSVPNILALTSVWSWPQPEYYPYAARLDRVPFDVLQYTLAVAAGAGLLLAQGRRRLVAFCLGAVGLVTIFVLKGVHPPLSKTSLWLYDHLPGYWLFREPSKARLILVLVFSLLAGVAVLELLRWSRVLAVAMAALLVGGAVAYSYPLVTGAVAPDKRPLLPSTHVTIPDAWERAASYINSLQGSGKVVAFPRLDFYQAPTTWGYYGASFLGQLIHRPVIELAPGGYFADQPVTALVDSLQDKLLKQDGDVSGVLQALGARYVLLRRDLDTSFPGRSFVPPSQLARVLPRTPGLRHIRSFGLVDLYEATHVSEPEVYAARPVIWRGNDAALYRVLPFAALTALVPPAARERLNGFASGEARLTAAHKGILRLTVAQKPSRTKIHVARAAGPPVGSSPRRPTTITFSKLSTPLELVLGSGPRVVRHPGRTTYSRSTTTPLYRFPSTEHPKRIAIPTSLAREVGDCNAYDDRSPREVGLSARLLSRDGGRTIRLSARDHSACVALPLPFHQPTPLLLRVRYWGVSGSPPRVCIWQDRPGRCVVGPPLNTNPGWHQLKAVVRPAPEAHELRLFFYADGAGGSATVTEYRDVSIQRGRPEEAIAVVPDDRLPRISYRRVSPYEFRAHVVNARRPFLLVAAETYAPGWRVEAKGRGSDGVEHLRVNGYANGWRIPWEGTYDLTISYAPERLARLAGLADLFLVPLSLMLFVGGRIWTGRRPGARYLERSYKREPVSPELMLVDPELAERARRGEGFSPNDE